jgi:hypothetical protein
MQHLHGPLAFGGVLFAVHVQRQALLQMLLGPDAVDTVLCLAEAAVRPLHRVTRRSQQLVIQELQRLLQHRALQLVQALAQLLEPPHAGSQPLEFFQGCLGLATAVKQPVHLFHDLPKRSQFGPPPRQFLQLLLLGRAEVMTDEQVPVLEQFRHAPFLPGNQPGLALMLLAGPATRLLGDLRGHLLAEFRQCVQYRFVDLLEDMELTDLVAGRGPQLLEYLGVKRRSVRGDAEHAQAAFVQLPLELGQESEDVLLSWVVLQDAESQAVVAAIVHHAEDAEGAVVGLVDGQVTGKVGQGLVEVGGRDAISLFFSTTP